MFLHKGKEYYPLEITGIIQGFDSIIYDRNKRKKPYIYLAINTETKETENG